MAYRVLYSSMEPVGVRTFGTPSEAFNHARKLSKDNEETYFVEEFYEERRVIASFTYRDEFIEET